ARSDLDPAIRRRAASSSSDRGTIRESGFSRSPGRVPRQAGNSRVASSPSYRTAPLDAANSPPFWPHRAWPDAVETQGAWPGVAVRVHRERLAGRVAVDRSADAGDCQLLETPGGSMAT